MSWILDSLKNGGFCDFVEYDTACLFLVKSEHLAQVPGYRLSLAVLIGSQPYLFGSFGISLKFLHHLYLFLGYFVGRLQGIHIYTYFLFLQVSDMTIARHNLKVITEKLFNRLRLGRRLYYYKIFLHNPLYIYKFGCKSKQKTFYHLII